MGWLFLWSFLDKLFGLGFATDAGKGWIDGGSPTYGFLKFGTKGPFVEFFQGLAGDPTIDLLFMLGLLLIGISFIFGVGVRVAAFSGVIMMALMYVAGSIQPKNNPLIDQHVIYALVFVLLCLLNSGRYLGLGNWWENTRLVKLLPFLK